MNTPAIPLKPLQHRLADAGAAFLQHMGLAQIFGGDAAQVLALGAANAACVHQLGHGGQQLPLHGHVGGLEQGAGEH